MVLGFLKRRRLYRLRKKYDRVREKVDKVDDAKRRFMLLKMLDQINPSLVMLEEQNIPLVRRTKLIHYVKNGVSSVKEALKAEDTPLAQKAQNIRG